ncbi:ROK family protein [Paenibacillus sp. CAA11]|uniref:ROK family protein n=1 Tax=Paenibacillus sp. CAA11 TaxID=1532905 RepID=UPI0019005322|nr:ROK family protein [Paenibacillus sp. CAA11]
MKQTGDQFLVKKINKSIVLETIRSFSPISRAKVSELTGLNKGTVSSLVSELMESDLVSELGPGESSGGRKPLILIFNRSAGHAIGVDIQVDAVSAVVTDLQGAILGRTSVELSETEVPAVIRAIRTAVEELAKLAPPSAYGIVGVGVGVPGIVDGSGTVLFAPNLRWSEVKLQEILVHELQLPVIIDNEANAGAEGEKLFGAGRDVDNLIYLSVSHGIGTGIILNREIYKGASGFSGEAGHFSIVADGIRCTCGNYGCWELYASENALLEEADRLLHPHKIAGAAEHRRNTLEELIELAAGGDDQVVELFKQTGKYLGIGIANLVNVFNPELILIGNRMALAEEFIASTIIKTVNERSLFFHRNAVRIEFSHLNLDSTVLGAASFALSQFFGKTRVSVES